MSHSFDECTSLTVGGIENLVSYLQIYRLQIQVISNKIKGVFVIHNELELQNVHESPKIEHSPFSNQKNQTQPRKRKRK